jgi:periplasmic protein TonB
METRKNKQANLEARRPGWFLLGLVFATGCTLAAFEWKTSFSFTADLPGETIYNIEEDVMTPIVILKPEIPEKKVVTQPQKSSQINITPNVIEISAQPDESNNLPDVTDLSLNQISSGPEIIIDPRGSIFDPVEEMPQFPGGDVALQEFLYKNLVYPERPRKMGISGTVYVEFIIDEEGNVTAINIAKGAFSDLDAEALRVVKLMPKWIPGKQRTKPVKVGLRMPVKFALKKNN